ncbi:MAG TPA: helix-turn-helix domain-containing protein [Terracidiphilus sp.]|jgi:AraC-like DNA-binding protein
MNPHSIVHARPAPGLEAFVRCYGQRRGRIAASAAVVQPVHARAACILEFNLGDRSRVRYSASGLEKIAQRAVLIGLQTFRRATLHMSGTVDSFGILFQPAGLHRLFAVPVSEVTDSDHEAEAVLGRGIIELEMRLADCRTFQQRVAAADRFLVDRIAAGRESDGVAAAADWILRNPGAASIAALTSMTGLSLRQFERRFASQIGMSPKLFACIVRFEAVMDRMTRGPDASWTDTAHRFGYHDQMHMVHDIERFTGETPTKILDVFQLAFHEAIDGLRASGDPTHILRDSRLIL